MVDANTSSTQQASDAQHVDNMTSMQQSTPDAPSGARSDAPVQTNNVGSQDGPSQLNSNPSGNSANSNNIGSGQQNSVINGGFSGNLGGGVGPGDGGAGGILNGLAGNGGGAGGDPGQGGAGNTGGNNGSAGSGNGGTGSSTAGVVATAGAGGTGGFGGAGNTGATGATNVVTSGGGEGGGNPPSANTNTPTNATNRTTPLAGPVATTDAPTPTDADNNFHSSGNPSFSAGVFYDQYTTGHLSIRTLESVYNEITNKFVATATGFGFTQYSDINFFGEYSFDDKEEIFIPPTPFSDAKSYGAFSPLYVNTYSAAAWNQSLAYRLFFFGEQQDLCVVQTNQPTVYGSFSIDHNGDWIYTLNNAPLDKPFFVNGQTYSDTFTVKYEGHPSVNITINLKGTENGTAVIIGDPASSNNGHYRIDPRHLTQDITDHSNLIAQGTVSVSTDGYTAIEGNIGRLVVSPYGDYTYVIDDVPVNSLGQLSLADSIKDTIVLGHFSTIFSEDISHTDSFNLALTDGSSEALNFHLSNAFGGSISYNSSAPTASITPITFSYGGGIQSVSVLEGNDTQNVHFAQNIGHLIISNVEGVYSYSYTVTNADITNWQNSLGTSFSSAYALPHVDTFIVSSISDAAGTRDVYIQEISFNVFQTSHVITVAPDATYNVDNSGSDIYRYNSNSWDSIFSASGDVPTAHTARINNFDVDYDRIDLSGLLTNSAYQLKSTVYIDNTSHDSIWTWDSDIIDPIINSPSHTDLSIIDGSHTWVVANLHEVEASLPEIMWNNEGIAGPVSALNAARTWTDIVDITSVAGSNVGPAAIIAADGEVLAGSWVRAAEPAAWTILIKSGTATVDTTSANPNIHFDAPHSGEVTITTADGNLHYLKNVDVINWHAAG